MPRVNLLPLFVVAVLILGFVRGFAAETDTAAELVAAIAKLQATSYRKRDQMQGMASKAQVTAPIAAEYSGDRSRMVMEMNLPKFGMIRQEQVTVGKRSAVRLSAPGITKKLEETKRNLSMNTARLLLQEIMQVAVALETGGLSTMDLVRTAVNTGLQTKTTAEARAALDRAMSAFSSWHEIKEEVDNNAPVNEAFNSFPTQMNDDLSAVTKEISSGGKVIKYTKRPPVVAGAPDFYMVISVDANTGLPTTEETFLNGQPLMTSEYTDIGAPISIEIPDCLK